MNGSFKTQQPTLPLGEVLLYPVDCGLVALHENDLALGDVDHGTVEVAVQRVLPVKRAQHGAGAFGESVLGDGCQALDLSISISISDCR